MGSHYRMLSRSKTTNSTTLTVNILNMLTCSNGRRVPHTCEPSNRSIYSTFVTLLTTHGEVTHCSSLINSVFNCRRKCASCNLTVFTSNSSRNHRMPNCSRKRCFKSLSNPEEFRISALNLYTRNTHRNKRTLSHCIDFYRQITKFMKCMKIIESLINHLIRVTKSFFENFLYFIAAIPPRTIEEVIIEILYNIRMHISTQTEEHYLINTLET